MRVEMVVPGVDVDLRRVKSVVLARERHLAFERVAQEALNLGDLVGRVCLDRIGRFHLAERDRDVHVRPTCA